MAIGVEVTVTGSDLPRLAAALKEAGRNDLRKELLASFRAEGRPLAGRIRESAAATLPRSGGLAGIVAASKVTTRTRLAGRTVGVNITGTGLAPLRRLNAGTVRHPLFGNTGFWFTESVTPGWFEDPIKADAGQLQGSLNAAMGRVAQKLEAV